MVPISKKLCRHRLPLGGLCSKKKKKKKKKNFFFFFFFFFSQVAGKSKKTLNELNSMKKTIRKETLASDRRSKHPDPTVSRRAKKKKNFFFC